MSKYASQDSEVLHKLDRDRLGKMRPNVKPEVWYFAQFMPLCAAGRREEGKGELGKMATFAVLRDARGDLRGKTVRLMMT